VKAKGEKFGHPTRNAEDRSHSFGKKIGLAPNQVEPAAFYQ